MSKNKRDVKLTLADLIAKKAAKEEAQNRTKDVYVESLEGSITIRVPDRSAVYKAIDMMGEKFEDNVYGNAYLIFNSVKEFREPELLQAYEVKDNIDIVGKLLEPVEIAELGAEIMQLAGFAKPDQIQSDLKK